MAKEASFYPAMIEKSKIHQCLQQYNIANDLAMKCLRIVPNNIDVLQILLLNQYITCHTQSDRTMYLHQLEQNLNLIELPPTDLCLQIVRLFCQVCSDDDDETLGMMSNLISPIVQLNTEDVAARVEWAHLLRRLGKIEDALAEYQNIVLLNEDKVEVALGIVHCNIMHGNIHEAKDQLDFMSLSYDKDVKMRYVGIANSYKLSQI
jgi:tetratricopeptide (TPR) repeat protein